MKRFLYKISAYVLLLFALTYSADALLVTGFRYVNKNRFAGWQRQCRGEINADVVVMGNSRAMYMYSPQILDSVLSTNSFNLGKIGTNFNKQRRLYEVYVQRNSKPRCIIQNIDIHTTLGYSPEYEMEFYFPYLYTKEWYRHFAAEPTWYFSVPLMRFRGWGKEHLKHAFFESYEDKLLYKGYQPRDLTWDGKNVRNMDSLSFTCQERTKKLFVDYVSQIKADSMDIIFVYAPTHKEGVDKIKRAELARFYALFDSIAQANDVPILDYTYHTLSYDTTYFYNATHLNRQGAERFSTLLAQDIDSLGLLTNRGANRYMYVRREE